MRSLAAVILVALSIALLLSGLLDRTVSGGAGAAVAPVGDNPERSEPLESSSGPDREAASLAEDPGSPISQDADQDASEPFVDTSVSEWFGRPRLEFLQDYWGMTEDEIREAMLAQGLPKRIIDKSLEGAITEHFRSWENTRPVLTQQLTDNLTQGSGNIEKAFQQANLGSFPGSVSKAAALMEERGFDRSGLEARLEAALKHQSSGILAAQEAFIQALVQRASLEVETGQFALSPFCTMPHAGDHLPGPAPGASTLFLGSSSKFGWTGIHHIHTGEDPALDSAFYALQDAWKAAFATAIAYEFGVGLSDEDLSELGF